MKKLWYLSILVSLLLAAEAMFAQTTFESTAGSSSNVEYPWFTWDGQQLETSQYLMVSGTKAYTGQRSGILLNRLNSTGAMETLSGLLYTESGNLNFEPRTLKFNPKAVSGEIHLYIGGKMQATGANPRAFLVRTLASGTPRDGGGYHLAPLSDSHSESIAAVERLANFDIAVAGTTDMPESGGILRQIFFVTRFSKSPSTRKWSYRYTLPATSTKNYVVKEACVGKIFLPGAIAETEVLALTGSMYDKAAPSNKHTFVCCINLADGAVLWTNIANSGLGMDEGMDLVQNPYTREFVAVGYAAGTAALPSTKRMWVCKFDQNGAFMGGGLYTPAEANQLDMVARDVCPAIDGNGIVVTGYREIINTDQIKRRVAFIMNLLPVAPFYPLWAKWYERSAPSLDADESIHPVNAPAPGYLVTTSAQAILPGRYDAHAIRVSPDGSILGGACPITEFTPLVEKSGSGVAGDAFVRKTSTWKFQTLNFKYVTPEGRDFCGTSHVWLPSHDHKALALSWTGQYDTDIKFSDFLTGSHSVSFRFMPQYPNAYYGPVLSGNTAGRFAVGQGDFDYGGGKRNLYVEIGSQKQFFPVDLKAGTWYHAVLTCQVDATSLTFTLYLNGSALSPKVVVSKWDAQLPSGGSLRLGRQTDGVLTDNMVPQFYGLIDDIAIFNKVVSAAEISVLAANKDIADLADGNLNAVKLARLDFNGSPASIAGLSGAASLVAVSADKTSTTDAASMALPSAQQVMTLPFPPGEAWKIIQGVDQSGGTHKGYASFCWDFVLSGLNNGDEYPSGTNNAPMYACASGKVVKKVDTHAANTKSLNLIELLAGPGEYHAYLHMNQNSSSVSIGQWVESGQAIAKTGNVCEQDNCSYHLHFAAGNTQDKATGFVTFPVAFSNYEVYRPATDSWEFVSRGIPQSGEVVRNPPAPDLPYRFVAVWQPTGEGEYQAYGYTQADLKKAYDGVWADGWRLTQIQSHVDNGELVYTAVWKQTYQAERNAFGMTQDEFKAFYDAIWADGWRIHLLDVCVIDGEPRYTATWRQTFEDEFQIYSWYYPEFKAKYDELWPQGWRLKNINTFVIDGNFYYTAVWNMQTADEIQVYAWNYEEFRKRYDELWPDGWRLALIDIAVESKTPYYTAVWRRSGEGEIQVYEWDYKNFKNRYNHLWKDGWRLKLLDVWSSKGIEEGRPGSRSSAAPHTGAGLFTATLFPNPSGKDSRVRLHIELPQDQPVRINAWDMAGKLYWTTESPLQHGEQDVDIPTDALAPGVYLLEIATPTGRKTIKWMVTATD